MKLRATLTLLLLASTGSAAREPVPPYAEFADRRDPPPYRTLSAPEREAFDLGIAVFNTQWVVAGAPRAQRRDGLGPVFNAASCDACHNNGARGRAPSGSGPLTAGLVVQLSDGHGPSAAYGHVLNTAAIEGYVVEGEARVVYGLLEGRYPDGRRWSLRVPRYELSELRHGALAPGTLVKPRLAPALFGAGLLDAVPEAALQSLGKVPRRYARGKVAGPGSEGRAITGRFGWQADSPTLADQTARALSREMGLRSTAIPVDDCGSVDRRCLEAVVGGTPEVSDAFMDALIAFQRWLAVPLPVADAAAEGAVLFTSSGCSDCHVPELPVEGLGTLRSIRPYTDLLLHDMGPELADRDAAGNAVASRWRTAPLWGLGHADRDGRISSLMHDGRARTIEEAILWHAGEAAEARELFGKMSAEHRQQLLDWLAAR